MNDNNLRRRMERLEQLVHDQTGGPKVSPKCLEDFLALDDRVERHNARRGDPVGLEAAWERLLREWRPDCPEAAEAYGAAFDAAHTAYESTRKP
jgi:hypothetical protein